MEKHIIIIKGTRFTIWAESTGVGIILEDEKTNEKIGEVFTENYEGNHMTHVFHGDKDEPEESIEI